MVHEGGVRQLWWSCGAPMMKKLIAKLNDSEDSEKAAADDSAEWLAERLRESS